MQAYSRRALLTMAACLVLLLFGCTFPLRAAEQGTPNPTDYVTTLSALQTRAVMTATAQGVAGAPTEQAPIPVSGGTPGTQMVIVINDTLCWRGPGPAYEVVSALFKGTHVQLLGRTVLAQWYIVLNPVFQDPCWVQASDVQVDQSLLAGLPVYAVPVSGLVTPVPTVTRRPPVLTPTPPVVTSTPPAPTSPAPTATSGAPTATQPAPTSTQPAPTATQAPPADTQPAATATQQPASTPTP